MPCFLSENLLLYTVSLCAHRRNLCERLIGDIINELVREVFWNP